MNLYRLIWQIVLPILERNPRLRQGIKERTSSGHLEEADIWIQGASAGESYLAAELATHFCNKSIFPLKPTRILLTSTTSQGMENYRKASSAISVDTAYFPFDIPDLIESVLLRVKPSLIILIETELWPSLMTGAKKHGIRIAVINGRLSAKSYRNYIKTRWLWEQFSPDIILAISNTDAQRFKSLFPCARISVMSNMKFDTISVAGTDLNEPPTFLPFMISSTGGSFSILASVRREEESDVLVILNQILARFPDQVVGLFPRHTHRIGFWKKTLAKTDLKWILRSEIKNVFPEPAICSDIRCSSTALRSSCSDTSSSCSGTSSSCSDTPFPSIAPRSRSTDIHSCTSAIRYLSTAKPLSSGTVILWDTFGELKSAYTLATVAFVGGSLKPLGGHNFIEPLASGTATVTGPFVDDFAWVGEEIFNNNMVRKAADRDGVVEFIISTLRNPPDRKEVAEKGLEYIRARQGGTAMASKIIRDYMRARGSYL
ncbi:MAG: hypothetical protein HQK61_04225 [Desulfamplus sp.]|nr:hypothetical protein [Desulfamplus sp.]